MQTVHRRAFLSLLAGSPLLQGQQGDDILTDFKQALNIMDFEAAARKAMPPAHWGYLSTGVEDDLTLKANREGFKHYFLRPRRLVDIGKVDTRVELFGTVWESPIGLSPIGNMKAFHAEGEVPASKAAKSKHSLQILSTMTTTSYEDVAANLGRPPWYQLYTTSRWEITEKLVKRVEAAGCPVVAVTVDTQAGRRTETFERSRKFDTRDCKACHGTLPEHFYRRKPMFQGIDVKQLRSHDPALNWKHIERLRKLSAMKLLVKGIETGEDARLCVETGVDGLIVSNHGGRAGETGRGTIECLPEVIDGVKGRIPVLIDGGFRRGSDVYKALALGAKAVCIGRPYIWGLAAFGQEGVEKIIDLMRMELELVMKQCGTPSIASIGRASIGTRESAL